MCATAASSSTRRARPWPIATTAAIWIDAGRRDEWFLDLGAQAFRAAYEAAGASVTHFEPFDAGHGDIEYRYPLALRHLAERLAAAA